MPLSEGLLGEGAWLPREQQLQDSSFRRPGGQYLEASPRGDSAAFEVEVAAEPSGAILCPGLAWLNQELV